MEHLNGAGGRQNRFGHSTDRLAGGAHQNRPNPFAAGEHRVAHRFVKSAGQAVDVGEEGVEPPVHKVEPIF